MAPQILHDFPGATSKTPGLYAHCCLAERCSVPGPQGEIWSGVGVMAGWLKKLKDAGEDIERFRVQP